MDPPAVFTPTPPGQAGFPGPEVPGEEPPDHTPASGAAQTRGGEPPALRDGGQHGEGRGADRVRGRHPGSEGPRGRVPQTALPLFL